MNQLHCDAILFDVDGVLVDSAACVERHWHRWAVEHEIDAQSIIAIAHGRRTAETIEIVAPHLDAASEAVKLASREETDTTGICEVPGAQDLLACLPVDAWAVATSGNTKIALTRLAHVSLPPPAVLITADHVSRGKPHPEPYLSAAHRLGVSPQGCVVVEDSPAGVDAGLAAGMQVVAIASTHRRDALEHADMVLDRLLDLVVRVDPNGGSKRLTIESRCGS